MAQRITEAHLEGKVRIINRSLGFTGDEGYNTKGLVVLDGAYGGTAVHRYTGESGSVSQLTTGHITKREVALFLDGMIAALRIKDED